MQQIDVNWLVFGLSLAGLLLFGILYSLVIRWGSKKEVEGQTAWAVVVGVTATLLAMIPTFGLATIALMFAGFAASGIPMIVEYVLRINKAQRSDKESAKGLAKDLLPK
jgi:hypothetical protein